MGSLREDIDLAAGWAAKTLAAEGYVTDRSWASLREIDRFLDRNTKRGRVRRRSILTDHAPTLLFGVVAYVGSVLCQQLGGEWLLDDDAADGELTMAVSLRSGTQVRPAMLVLDRIRHGKAALIAEHGEALRVHEPVSAA